MLLHESHTYYSVSELIMPYFESISIYLKGEDSEGKSGLFFEDGFVSVFSPSNLSESILRRIAKILYKDARCGFFHDNMIRKRIFFTDAPSPINPIFPKVNGKLDTEGEIKGIFIDAEKLFNRIESHFKEYLIKLRNKNNAEIRGNFKRACEIKEFSGLEPIEYGPYVEY